MQPQLTPSFFYGAAAAAVMGLSLGIALHGPWQSKAGGPRIAVGSAAAAEPADVDGGFIQASNETTPTADAYLYDGYTPTTPLPVTRLKPDRYPNLWPDSQTGVTQASVGAGERVDADNLYGDDAYRDDLYGPDRSARERYGDDRYRDDAPVDEELPAPDQTPRAPVRYSALNAAEAGSAY